jgi:hypothetical protein
VAVNRESMIQFGAARAHRDLAETESQPAERTSRTTRPQGSPAMLRALPRRSKTASSVSPRTATPCIVAGSRIAAGPLAGEALARAANSQRWMCKSVPLPSMNRLPSPLARRETHNTSLLGNRTFGSFRSELGHGGTTCHLTQCKSRATFLWYARWYAFG